MGVVGPHVETLSVLELNTRNELKFSLANNRAPMTQRKRTGSLALL